MASAKFKILGSAQVVAGREDREFRAREFGAQEYAVRASFIARCGGTSRDGIALVGRWSWVMSLWGSSHGQIVL
jgi:hypothetical protein